LDLNPESPVPAGVKPADTSARPRHPEEVPFDERRGRERTREETERGVRFFQGGRFEEAANAFSRAVFYEGAYTGAFFGLSLEAFVRGHWLDAAAYLSRAMRSSSDWLQKALPPRDFFASDEAYVKYLGALEKYVRENPLDADAKWVLAFHWYFAKSPQHAKALLTEIQNLQPENPDVREFLSQLP
jgi:tetratricopeptide (TPR) repeat protein